MAKWVKNDSGGDKTWVGQFISNQAYYKLQSHEEISWANNTTLLIDIANGKAIVAKDDSGTNDISDVNTAVNYLKGNLPQEMLASIREESVPTGGHYQAQSFKVVCDATSGWKHTNISFPHPIGLLSSEWINEVENDGDEVDVCIAPDTIIGTITADVSGGTVIDVSQTVVDNTSIGYALVLTDGVSMDDLGRVLAVDVDNLQVTVENAVTSSFTAVAPTYVKQTIRLIPNVILRGVGKVELGSSKIGASYLPANTIVRIRYNNISATAKTFSLIVEYLY